MDMNTLFWLSFLFSSSPPPANCSARGVPMLEIRDRSEVEASTSTTKIYASGAWTFESVDNNDTESRSTGCFAKTELRAIRRSLQRAPWRVTSSPIACFAYSPELTEYVFRGKLR